MSYSVEWKKTASDELAEIWLDARSTNRAEITAATGEVDRLLKSDPYGHGESREGTRRVMFVAPLAVSYMVDASAFHVEVRCFGSA